MQSSAWYYPQWIMTGMHTEHGVVIYASSELTYAEMSTLMTNDDVGSFSAVTPFPKPRVTLTAELRSFVVAYGKTYDEALLRLRDYWSPEPTQPEQAALPR